MNLVFQMNGIRTKDISTSQPQMKLESIKGIRLIWASHRKSNALRVHNNERDLCYLLHTIMSSPI